MANYFYAANGQSNGPLTIEQIDDLVKTGTVAPDTLVWSEGMTDWQPYATVRSGAAASAGTGAAPVALASPPVDGSVVCSVCGQLFPPDQVIRYGATPVCGGCKPQFLQRLREGAMVGGALDYASFGKRFGAKILDTILIYAVNFGVGFALGVNGTANPDLSMALVVFALNMAVGLGYPIFFLGKWGQTLGKMAAGIKVVSPTGESIGYGRAAGRVLAEIITGFTFGIGYLMVLWDAEKRSLHDRIASTRVVNVQQT